MDRDRGRGGAIGRAVRRFEPRPRLVDWSILLLVAFELGSGLLSLTVGRPGGSAVFLLHGVAGLTLVFLLFYKLRRVRRLWDRATGLSVLTTAVALAALGSGVFWVFGGDVRILYWNALSAHVLFGLLLLPLVLVHAATRARPPRRVDFRGRRTALQYAGLLVGGALVWRAQQGVNRLLDTAGADRRFTGSKPVEGASFPVTSWVADDPDPIDPDKWRLRVGGLVDEPYELAPEDLDGADELRALLDCTSGWYTVQDWRGVLVGDLLDRAGADPAGAWVRFVSVTGYRWSLPLDEARDALLATRVGGEPLSHGHGAPLRLVAPGRRGFQWVKWVEAVEVRDRRDPAQWFVTLVSGFD
ncbi:molybdopterin-dependent oxidoreductase [Halegenticoccus soli]|uniref:molybdopterin-dependent oxidoreductase n=1 Tax=Halegenticoccus soli TaxID=1985678 RepID=UPI000C6E7488|nr:molybdopterin-dependent oxidoreductase [Halegenticoccus soli]